MKNRLAASLLCMGLLSLSRAYGQIEMHQGTAQPQVTAFDDLVERLRGVQIKEATSCDAPKGVLSFGQPVSTFLGDSGSCYQSGAWADMWTFSGTARARVRATFSAEAQSLAAFQDYATGEILAKSSDTCGGLVSACTFEYTLPLSGQYFFGFAATQTEHYTLTLSLVQGGGGGGGLPNLTPYRPDGWSDKLVVSNVTGTHTDSMNLQATDTLYVDWAVLNSGTASAAAMNRSLSLYIDGVFRESWYSSSAMEPNHYGWDEDYIIGRLSAGTHTLRMVADPDNEIQESSENDNEYTKTITVSSGQSGYCLDNATTVCLNASRFSVSVNWSTTDGRNGQGQAVRLTDDTGYFWFFNYDNLELCVKVLDGRGINGHFWVFYGALSNVQYTITVTDTLNQFSPKTYVNPQGTMASVGDTAAF